MDGVTLIAILHQGRRWCGRCARLLRFVTSGHGQNPTHRKIAEGWRSKHYEDTLKMQLAGDGVKQGGDWFNSAQPSMSRLCSSKSTARKAASAHIAKIPMPLACHIARMYHP